MRDNSAPRCPLLAGAIAAAAVLLAVGISPGAQAQTGGRRVHAAHFVARISAKQAQAAALQTYPGKVEGKIALENEEGSWQYAVNVRSGHTLREVMVNATTGKIASVETTSKAEEASEQKAERKAASHGNK